MNIQYCDTKAYWDYRSKIDILKDTIELRKGLVGDILSFYIIDNNKKHFKRQYITSEYLEITNEIQLDNYIQREVAQYVKNKNANNIQIEIYDTIIKRFKGEIQ